MNVENTFFHIYWLDDLLDGDGPNRDTFRRIIQSQVFHGGDVSGVRFWSVPEEFLAEIRKVAGLRPLALIIDLNLGKAKNSMEAEAPGSAFASQGGGFEVWAEVARETRHLPDQVAPFALVYTADPTIKPLYQKVQPRLGSTWWLTEEMRPLVLTFESKTLSDTSTLVDLLKKWRDETRAWYLRVWSMENRIRVVRDRVQKSFESTGWESAWVLPISLPLGGRNERAWRGNLALLFPEYHGQLRAASSAAASRSILAEVGRALCTSLPDFVRLACHLLTADRTELQADPWFRSLMLLPASVPPKLDHVITPEAIQSNEPDPVGILRPVAELLWRELWFTLETAGLKRYSQDAPQMFPPGGLLDFLNRLRSLKTMDNDGWIDGWNETLCQVGARGLAGRQHEEQSQHNALAFLPVECWVKLLEQFNTILTGSDLERRYKTEVWREFIRYFPISAEFGEIVKSVMEKNRKDGSEEWFARVERQSGGIGKLVFQILGKTQADETNPLDVAHIRQKLTEPLQSQKLTELRALVCGQYGGRFWLLQGGKGIRIAQTTVDAPGLPDLPIFDELGQDDHGKDRYDVDRATVAGTWYLIEIESREQDT